jgi:hypothetical protein
MTIVAPKPKPKPERFACDLCNVTCSRVDSLKKHKQTAHEDNPHTCRICGKHLRNPANGQYHLKNCHRVAYDDAEGNYIALLQPTPKATAKAA